MFEYITNFEIGVLILTLVSGFLVVYSHVVFPIILRMLRKKTQEEATNFVSRSYVDTSTDNELPTMTIVIPAYNEEEFIAEKITNLATLDYPSDKLNVVVYCDGCTDYTALAAEGAIYSALCSNLNVELIEAERNIGKIAALNKIIPTLETDIIALSDVSALLSIDALLIAAKHLEDKKVGFVGGTYDFAEYGSSGEETYWSYQRCVKEGEGALGGPIGCHGAFYLFRKELFKPLAKDTVNDDFILPMEILAQNYKGVYEPKIMALELEQAEGAQDFNRRIRIATGNVQQVFRLIHLLNPKHGGIALSFFSGKTLRAFMPVLLALCLVGSLTLSQSQNGFVSSIFAAGFSAQTLVYAIALFKSLLPKHKVFEAIYYLVSGHVAGAIGLYRFTTGKHQEKWERTALENKGANYSPMAVRFGKRAFDICAALTGLAILAPLFPLLALLIKLDSPGPVIFRQKRVGLSTPNFTGFFQMYKFRTMVQDAEKVTGAVWAQKNDPRITRSGKFMRQTRLDELPQFWNVLRGDMSLIGPRPERPELYGI